MWTVPSSEAEAMSGYARWNCTCRTAWFAKGVVGFGGGRGVGFGCVGVGVGVGEIDFLY